MCHGFSLWHINNRTFKVFNKETKRNKKSASKLSQKAFPAVPDFENKYVLVRSEKSPCEGDIAY
jgi:RNA-directed DNA polymerase